MHSYLRVNTILNHISDYAALIAQFERDEQFANRSRSQYIFLIDCKSVRSTAWYSRRFRVEAMTYTRP